MTENTKNYFEELSQINVSDKIERKNGLSYLSWAFAWSELKKRYPNAKKSVIKNEQGWLYHTDGKTCWVEVSVTICDIEEAEYLPVMDYKNQPIPLERITSTAVNTALQRAITKAIARHGLGLYIYAGEDLPETADNVNTDATGNEEAKSKFSQSRRTLPEKKGTLVNIAAEVNDDLKEAYSRRKRDEVYAIFEEIEAAIVGHNDNETLTRAIEGCSKKLDFLKKHAEDLFHEIVSIGQRERKKIAELFEERG